MPPKSEVASEQLHDLFCCTWVWKWPPFLAAFWWMTGVHDARQRLPGQHEVGERFVVLEQRIEPGAMLSDQLALKDKGLLRRWGDDAFDVVCTGHQFRNHGAVGRCGKIRANPFREARGFADVENAPFGGLEQVHARPSRQVHAAGIDGHLMPPAMHALR